MHYQCTRLTFRPRLRYPVRWLDWDADLSQAQAMWPDTWPLTPAGWREARDLGYRYCAAIEQGGIQSIAAVWRYSEAAWEVAAVRTRPEARRQEYAQAAVSLVVADILNTGRRSTCTTAADNTAMQRTAESIGFYPIDG